MKKGLRRMYLAFLSPVVIAFLIAYLYPVLRTVQMSFFEVSDISAARDTWEFVGLYNYVDLFSRQLFRVSFKNMMLIFLAGGAAVFLISLFFAWVLHKGMFMGNLWRNLIYLPTVITPVAMITVWTACSKRCSRRWAWTALRPYHGQALNTRSGPCSSLSAFAASAATCWCTWPP